MLYETIVELSILWEILLGYINPLGIFALYIVLNRRFQWDPLSLKITLVLVLRIKQLGLISNDL